MVSVVFSLTEKVLSFFFLVGGAVFHIISLYLKRPGFWECSSVVEDLPSMHKALGFIPITINKGLVCLFVCLFKAAGRRVAKGEGTT
jgi:hypothetical protein